MRVGSFWALAFATLSAAGSTSQCAKTQCTLNSDCGPRRYCDLAQTCRQDCAEDRDCADGYCDPNGRCQMGMRPDSGVEDVPMSVDTGMGDAGSVDNGPIDTGTFDTGAPPPPRA